MLLIFLNSYLFLHSRFLHNWLWLWLWFWNPNLPSLLRFTFLCHLTSSRHSHNHYSLALPLIVFLHRGTYAPRQVYLLLTYSRRITYSRRLLNIYCDHNNHIVQHLISWSPSLPSYFIPTPYLSTPNHVDLIPIQLVCLQDYLSRKTKMQCLLISLKLYGMVDGSIPLPNPTYLIITTILILILHFMSLYTLIRMSHILTFVPLSLDIMTDVHELAIRGKI